MNQYEIAVLYDPDLEVDLSKAEERVKKIITDNNGEIKTIDNWGKRKLAYPIKHNEHAIYVFYTVELPAESVSKVDNSLNITDEVIRYLITKPDLKAIAKAEAEKAEKAERLSSSVNEAANDQAEDNENER